MTDLSDNNNNNSNKSNESRLARTREIIVELHKINSEVIVPSEGEPFVESRDPHLRLRRTLTPPSHYKGISPEEAQFMIQNCNGGERESLYFKLGGNKFQVDGYFWGASESKATRRIFAVHGVTPGISRTRWHALGQNLASVDPGVRFCAIDWHSLDRTDKPQTEFLTMLPKHYFDPVDEKTLNEIYEGLPTEKVQKMKKIFASISQQCPHTTADGASVLKAMITQGCGWGMESSKKFAICIKSWSGSVGMEMLLESTENPEFFRQNIAGAVIMHPAFMKFNLVDKAIRDIPTIMCWAKDDPKVPYNTMSPYYKNAGASFDDSPTTGGHANFMEFDIPASKFLLGLQY